MGFLVLLSRFGFRQVLYKQGHGDWAFWCSFPSYQHHGSALALCWCGGGRRWVFGGEFLSSSVIKDACFVSVQNPIQKIASLPRSWNLFLGMGRWQVIVLISASGNPYQWALKPRPAQSPVFLENPLDISIKEFVNECKFSCIWDSQLF